MSVFNQYQWKLYKNSLDGSRVIHIFDDFINNQRVDKVVELLTELHRKFCPDKKLTAILLSNLQNTVQYFKSVPVGETADDSIEDDTAVPADEESIDKVYANLIADEWNHFSHDENGTQLSEQDSFYGFISIMEDYTLYASYYQFEFYIPYCFKNLYNVLYSICSEFEISLPEIPVRNNYKGRFEHYFMICKALYEFRLENDLSPAELWAFLYDYANGVIGYKNWLSSIPGEPRRAFFCGGNKNDNGDQKHLEELSAQTPYEATFWQGSPDAERNDIYVMYLLSPFSSINYILQAASEGFIDPFFYFYRCIYLSHPVRTPQLPLKAMQADRKLAESIPLIRANMQGVNGRVISSDGYKALSDKLIAMGMNPADIPQLPEYSQFKTTELHVERDVEQQLIVPLLKRLGYSSDDYQQQLVIRVGRSNKAIPDFVVCPQEDGNSTSCDFVIEAKLSIPTLKQLDIDFRQAQSYANLLKAKYLLLASKEGVWFASSQDNFIKRQQFSWNQLSDVDVFNDLYKLIGNRAR